LGGLGGVTGDALRDENFVSSGLKGLLLEISWHEEEDSPKDRQPFSPFGNVYKPRILMANAATMHRKS
jgi:hypothetical protein